MRKIYISILLVLSFANAYTQTDSDSLIFTTPLINISSSRISLTYEDSFIPIQTFDRNKIINSNGNHISDVLQKANNVFIKSYGGESSLKTISINGMNAEHTLLMINGTRLNTVQNSQFDLSLISNNNIESIEVMPSGGSSFFGSDAMSGVVNIMTFNNIKSGKPLRFGASAFMNIGSYNYKNYGLDFNSTSGKHSFKTSFNSEKSDDDFEYYYFNMAEDIKKRRTNNSFEKNDALVQYSYIGDNFILNLLSFYDYKTRHLPGVESGNTPMNARQTDEMWNSIVNLDRTFKNKNTFRASLNFQNYLMKYISAPSDDSYYRNLSATASASYQINTSKLRLLSGTDFLSAGITSGEIAGNKSRNVISLYSNLEYKILENLSVFPSARFENISDISKNVFTSKLGANYKPFNSGLIILRASAGNSFRAPTFNELYWKTGGNSNLLPERAFNLDAGILSEFEFAGDNSIEVNFNYISADNKILWIPGSGAYWSPVNIASSTSKVISIVMTSKKEFAKNCSLFLSANYSHNKSVKTSEDYPGDPSINKQLIYIPLDMIKVNAELKYKDSGVSIFGNFIGRRYSDYINTSSLKRVFLVDANIYTKIQIAMLKSRIAFEVNNITNLNYQLVAGYPMPMRTYKILITLSY
ncbi:MAG: TonB-dependent receptor [Ignavibacteria bacterium]|nr:TonB-dependent receptor [Ignavibacteria bacterium]